MSFFDFDMKKLEERVKALNPNITVLPVSAKTGEGIDAWAAWLEQAVSEWKKKN
jgi:hydrogenase nickel incorporation protein HypB